MPTPLPPSVREQFGEAAAEDFVRWLDETLQQQTVLRDEYREVLSRLDVIDERFKRIDERFEHIDERFERIDERFDRVDEQFDRVDERLDQINQRLDEQSHQFNQRIDEQSNQIHDRIDRLHEQMRVQTRWTVGTIALFGTIVTVLLAIAEFGG